MAMKTAMESEKEFMEMSLDAAGMGSGMQFKDPQWEVCPPQ
jgi:hypothetical protein